MDYEKKYKEALLKARDARQNTESAVTIGILEEIFPELAESEDDKIRKALLYVISKCKEEVFNRVCAASQKECIAWLEKQGEPQDKGEISDGYHTFNELYYYRMLYNAAFFNMLPKEWVHKSKKHHDGEDCFGGGWFIVMANLPTGQISNHYELKDWDLFQIPEKEVADKWDGHTPQEAADRLHKYLLEKQDKQPSAIRWYDVSLIPQEMEELLVEWDSEDATWHEIAFYHADTKTFWNGTRQVENVTRWCYITDLLEKQGEQSKKVSIWKHWKDGIAGNGEGTPVYLIKYGYTYSISSCLSFECDYIELSELDKLLSEKQDELTEINPSEFDLRLNKLLKQFESLPKEELISNLSYYLNVIQNDGTYKIEKQCNAKSRGFFNDRLKNRKI